jgi:quercetin dioxygenase-like cupin family protein
MVMFEKIFRLTAVVAVGLLPCVSNAQTGGGRPIRSVIALGRVTSLLDQPVALRLSRVSIPAGATTNYAGDYTAIYVLSGTLLVSSDGESRSLREGDGIFVVSNTKTTFQAGATAELIQYQLTAAVTASPTTVAAPAVVTELRRMEIPRKILQPGPYEFSLTRVTLSAGAAGPRPHTRSTAALYYVLAEGSITIWPAATTDALSGESRTESRPAGSIQEEPLGFIHTWSPKPDSALVLLQANISQEGVPEIIFVK